MKNAYRWIRAVTLTLILLAVGIPTSLFILLSVPSVQQAIKKRAEHELSTFLNSNVEIRDLAIRPFNRIALMDVSITDAEGEKAITIDRLGAGLSLTDILFFGDIVVNYVEIVGLDGRLYKENPDSPLNIRNITDALKPKEEKEETSFRLSISNILLRNIDFSYNVLSEAAPERRRFNRNHIEVNNLRADISIPILSNDIYAADIHRLALEERSGLAITDLHSRIFLSPDSVTVSDLGMELPRSSLRFSSLKLDFREGKNIISILGKNTIDFAINENSYVTPADLSCFFPPLGNFDSPMDLTLALKGDAEEFSLLPLKIKSKGSTDFLLEVNGKARRLLDIEGRGVNFDKIYLKSSGTDIGSLLPVTVPENIRSLIENIDKFVFQGTVELDEENAIAEGDFKSDIGNLKIDGKSSYDFSNEKLFPLDYSLQVEADDISLGELFPGKHFGNFTGKIASKGHINEKKEPDCEIEVSVASLDYLEYVYHDIFLNSEIRPTEVDISILSEDDPLFNFSANGSYTFHPQERKKLDFYVDAGTLNLYGMNLTDQYPGKSFSGRLNASLDWNETDDIQGEVRAEDISITDGTTRKVLLSNMSLEATGEYDDRKIVVNSDILDLIAKGRISLTAIGPEMRSMAHGLLPEVIPYKPSAINRKENSFDFALTLKEDSELNSFLNLPAYPLDRITVNGNIDTGEGDFNFSLKAPYIRQGDKLIKNTSVNISVADRREANVEFFTEYPTKQGPMTLSIVNSIIPDTVDTEIKWKIDRRQDYSGNVYLNTVFSGIKGENSYNPLLLTDISILESHMTFNDSLWVIDPAEINIAGNKFIKIDHLNIHGPNQGVSVSGAISENQSDELLADMQNIDLEYVFETLSIDNVKLGGSATGKVTASALLSNEPNLQTDGLSVKDISYNNCVIGDAVVLSNWDSDNKSVVLDADITQRNDLHSYINGAIFPTCDSLDINFKCDKVDIAFLQPYMQAFTSDVRGRATGEARLWGNFKYIDFEGKVFADSVRMKIDLTDTWYSATDTIVIDPGIINLDNLTLHDGHGHTAKLNGYVRHKYFKEPSFEFNITDADNLLVYDEKEWRNPRWYGTVYANGNAKIKGYPGYVGISCDMTTAAGTTFTYVLTDMEEAGEYTFIAYRDRDLTGIGDSVISVQPPPLVAEFLRDIGNGEDAGMSRHDIDLDIDITPEARMNLIMDPAGGDRIRSYGQGNMRITYNSVDEDLKMYGTYTLEKGDYNFTLQDIIIKDFTIRDGSSITFRGDPYAASLDITAIYSTNANLSDLDAMFLEDKDISRTNVPVHALLHISGDLHQPEISFDLEFPTLTQDTYRKVKSIVSTEEMMNRQIIYLLALNRFYTPEYMQSATRGNELISVASSTLSSQLSHILGQISDKFTIAPNIRSEKEDFSDMEVDLALSSTLLNNRLILNGNFGYRDNLMNTNQFIGDFDIEYLLNRKGTLRLKAYNRYNDRNFYYKTAATTQGVGIVVKHDFDSFTSFLNMFRKKKEEKNE